MWPGEGSLGASECRLVTARGVDDEANRERVRRGWPAVVQNQVSSGLSVTAYDPAFGKSVRKTGPRCSAALDLKVRQVCKGLGSTLQQLYLIAIRVIDKGHLATIGEFLPPAIGPDLDAAFLQLVTENDEVGHGDS